MLAGESFDVALDGRERQLDDGRSLAGSLLPTRLLEMPGAFALEFPRAWTWSGAVAAPGAALGWWHLGTEGSFVMLRRHDGDALAVQEEYLATAAATGTTNARDVRLVLDGRILEGGAFDQDGARIGHGPFWNWTHEVYGFEGPDGLAYLLVLQKGVRAEPSIGLPWDVLEIDFELVDDSGGKTSQEQNQGQPSTETLPTVEPAVVEPIDERAALAAAQSVRLGTLATVVESWRWKSREPSPRSR